MTRRSRKKLSPYTTNCTERRIVMNNNTALSLETQGIVSLADAATDHLRCEPVVKEHHGWGVTALVWWLDNGTTCDRQFDIQIREGNASSNGNVKAIARIERCSEKEER